MQFCVDMRVTYLQGSSKCSAQISLILGEKPGQAEISNPWLELFIKKNVAGFDIPMNNSEMRIFVQVLQTSSNSKNYLEASVPVQELIAFSCSSK